MTRKGRYLVIQNILLYTTSKPRSNINIAKKTPIEFHMSIKYRFHHKSAFILDAILNISICSKTAEWHHLGSSKAMSNIRDSAKKKTTLDANSRSSQIYRPFFCRTIMDRGNERLFVASGSHVQDGRHAHNYMVRTLQKSSSTDFHESWYVAFGTSAHHSLSK